MAVKLMEITIFYLRYISSMMSLLYAENIQIETWIHFNPITLIVYLFICTMTWTFHKILYIPDQTYSIYHKLQLI
jgi:hypothetical protein